MNDWPTTDDLQGTWRGADGFSDVTIRISRDADGQWTVDVRDDDETAEVVALDATGERLCFSVHWASNGRFVKYSLLALGDGRVDVRFNYSAQETWLRQDPLS